MLDTIIAVGLGYIRLGLPAATLSGGATRPEATPTAAEGEGAETVQGSGPDRPGFGPHLAGVHGIQRGKAS